MPKNEIHWTNDSVRLFAGHENPITKMEQTARTFVLRAIERGWSGPPFDPIELATISGMHARPNAATSEARVRVVNDKFIIEYNPNKSLGRLNYSVAHEIAHTFFADCSQKVRYRGPAPPEESDWQLEMLCNIGAAEILMPVGIFPSDIESLVSIEELMRLRQEFKVSAEAVLIRLVKLASSQIACFSATRIRSSPDSPYRIDYCIGSRVWRDFERNLRRSSVFSQALSECIAIGTTAKGDETWLEHFPKLRIEAVALPPYPGADSLRIVGVLRPASAVPTVSDIEYRLGNAVEMPPHVRAAIVHVVNDKARSWGGFGFSRTLKKKYPNASTEYRRWTMENSHNKKLGCLHVAKLPDNKYVVSVVAQAGYGPATKPRIRYRALDDGLEVAAQRLQQLGVAFVQMPRIGSGQAGGNWKVIAGIIRERLVSSGLNVRVFDLP